MFEEKENFKKDICICFLFEHVIDSYITLQRFKICLEGQQAHPLTCSLTNIKTIRYLVERAVLFFLIFFSCFSCLCLTRNREGKKFYFSSLFLVSTNSQSIDDEYLLCSYCHHLIVVVRDDATQQMWNITNRLKNGCVLTFSTVMW